MHDPNMEYRNTWGEEIKLRDIVTWDDKMVDSEARKLNDWLRNDKLVLRQRQLVELMLGRVAFEQKARQSEVVSLDSQLQLELT